MEFSKKLQELRKQVGITQQELAEKLYVSRAAISKWESGRGYPNIDSLKQIAAFFSVTVDSLLSNDELLILAEANEKEKEKHVRDLIFGVIDMSSILLLFLPLFAMREGGAVIESSLIAFGGTYIYLKVAFYTAVILEVLMGVLTLAMQNVRFYYWVKLKSLMSIIISMLAVILFTLTLQPYAAVFALFLLAVKLTAVIKL